VAEQSQDQFAPGECAKRGYLPLEDLCFNAQQAAEKAIKALLIQRDAGFPYVHDIAALLTVLEQAGQEIPHSIKQAERLTRYPGMPPNAAANRRIAKRSVRVERLG
jgi:HEPN domain-containing protein